MSARYERSKIAAQKALNLDNAKSVTGSDPIESKTQAPQPYTNDLKNATDLSSILAADRKPDPVSGKAELQAAGSRQSVLDDKKTGGPSVLADEADEEQQARNNFVRRSPRKRATSGLSKDGLMGLKDRMTGTGHGRTAGIIGVDGGR